MNDVKYISYNPNIVNKHAGDCVVRALTILTGETWFDCYSALALKGLELGDMPSANHVWMTYLKELGYAPHVIPDTCPDCYTIKRFCHDHPHGMYVVGTGTHVVAVCNGKYYDSWDSGNEVPIIYFQARKDK